MEYAILLIIFLQKKLSSKYILIFKVAIILMLQMAAPEHDPCLFV